MHRPTILKFYDEKGINIFDCRGQYYNGAPNMQSLKKGAASYILKESPKAYTTRCCSHILNLSLASICKISIITNVLEIYKSVLIYFNTSPKRENLLIHIVEQKHSSEERKNVLTGVSAQKNKFCIKDFFSKCNQICSFLRIWSDLLKKSLMDNFIFCAVYLSNPVVREIDVSYQCFYLALPFLVEACEVINGTMPKGWNAKSKVEATQFLNSMTKFESVIGMITL